MPVTKFIFLLSIFASSSAVLWLFNHISCLCSLFFGTVGKFKYLWMSTPTSDHAWWLVPDSKYVYSFRRVATRKPSLVCWVSILWLLWVILTISSVTKPVHQVITINCHSVFCHTREVSCKVSCSLDHSTWLRQQITMTSGASPSILGLQWSCKPLPPPEVPAGTPFVVASVELVSDKTSHNIPAITVDPASVYAPMQILQHAYWEQPSLHHPTQPGLYHPYAGILPYLRGDGPPTHWQLGNQVPLYVCNLLAGHIWHPSN